MERLRLHLLPAHRWTLVTDRSPVGAARTLATSLLGPRSIHEVTAIPLRPGAQDDPEQPQPVHYSRPLKLTPGSWLSVMSYVARMWGQGLSQGMVTWVGAEMWVSG